MTRAAGWLSAALLLGGAAPGDAGQEPPPSDDRLIRIVARAGDGGGLRAGEPARIDVSVRDPASGSALGGLTPALWLVPDDGEQGAGRCERLVQRLATSVVPPEGTVDANGFDLIEATDDGKLALVDPLLNLATANIKAVANVGAVPRSWALAADGMTLAVAAPGAAAVQLVDLNRFDTARAVALPAAPHAVAAMNDGFRVGTSDGAIVTIGRDGRAGLPERLGSGPVALSGDGETLVALAASGEGAFLRRGGGVTRFSVGAGVAEVAYVPLADAAFMLADNGGTLVRVPQDGPDAPQRLSLGRPARAIAASPDGRWLALTSSAGDAVTIVDVARGRERWTVAANDPVIAAGFSDAFLYLVHTRQGGATRVVFDPAGGPPGTVTIAAGATRDTPQRAGMLPLLARIPGGGMLVASGRDRAAYMINDDNAQAAMSSLPLRAGAPAGILLRYRGLTPGPAPGSYRTQVVVPSGGPHLAVVRTEQPKVAHCMPIAVAGARNGAAPRSAALPAAVERHLTTEGRLAPGAQQLRFDISGSPAARLAGVTLIGDGWQVSPPEIASVGTGYAAPVDLAAGRSFTLFVRYRDGRGEGILTAPVEVSGR